MTPISTLPSAAPSRVGWVATATATSVTTEEVDPAVIDDYADDLAEFYGVEAEDVTVTTTYEATGTMQVTIPDDVAEEELVDTIASSIAESLGVHPSDVEVIVDMETGEVEFTVTSDSFEEATSNQFGLDNTNIQNAITDGIQEAIPEAIVEELKVSEDIGATLEFTVDANDAANDRTQAAFQSEELLSEFGDVTVEMAYVTTAPTFAPSISPTTSLPTSAPSITGSKLLVLSSTFEKI